MILHFACCRSLAYRGTLSVQAILGGSVQVPTLTGDVVLKVSCFPYVFIFFW
jgi:hypothetical protein